MATSLIAQPRQGRGLGPCQGLNQEDVRQRGIEMILPDLTDDQKTALDALRNEHFSEMKTFRNKMGEIRAQQKTVMSEYPIDEKAADKLIDQKTKLMNEQMKAQVAHRAAVNNVLTADQLLKLEQHAAKRQFSGKGNQGMPGKQGKFRGNYPQCPQGNFRGGNFRGGNFRGPRASAELPAPLVEDWMSESIL